MWVRKPEEELERQRAAREAASVSIWRPLLAATVLAGGSMALYAVGVRLVYGGVVVTTGEAAPDPVLFGLVGFGLFVGSFWYFNRRQRQSGRSPFVTGQSAAICNRCHDSTLEAVGGRCDCGGTYERLEDWVWVEEESESGSV